MGWRGIAVGDWLARGLIRRRTAILVGWLVVAAILVPLAGRLEGGLAVTTAGAGDGSAGVTKLLRERFASPFAETALLVATGLPDPRAEGRPVLREIVDSLAVVPGIAGTLSYLDSADPLLIGDDGTSALVIAGLDAKGEPIDTVLDRVRQATDAVTERLRTVAPAIRLHWTGETVLNHDIRAISQADARVAELRSLPVTFVVLVVVFGSLTAALLPLLAGIVAIPLALGVASLLVGLMPMSVLLVNVVSMIGLALSIDYALLLVDRFRRARARGCDVEAAAIEAAQRGGRTVATSGLAVAIGFAALLAVPMDELRSLAIGGLLATALAVLIATTLVPGMLRRLGDRIQWGRLPRLWPGSGSDRRWLGWGRFVAAHPMAVLLVAGLPVLALAGQAAQLRLELPRGEWLPAETSAGQAIHALRAIGRSGLADQIRIVVLAPPRTSFTDPEGWAMLQRLTARLAADPRLQRVTSLATLPGAATLGPGVLPFVPPLFRRALLSPDRQAALIEAVPAAGVESVEVSHLVRALKAASAQSLTGLPGAGLLIGGQPAFQVEYEDAVTGSFTLVAGLVLVGTFIALMARFRSILVPLKAVALNLLSVAAGFGALVVVIQDGHGAALLGIAGASGAVFPVVPALVFCAVFGLSMDYEIFLVSRVAELRRAGLDEGEAVAQGLARTGRLITGAAAVMIVIFAAFALGGFLLMKMLGFALAVTVLIDATVVRMAIGPALLRLAGRWNWWPGESAPVHGARTVLAAELRD
jgi:RND superfamily putative drug exporter